MVTGSRQRLSVQCDDVEIKIDDQIIKRVDHTKSLGLTIDVHLSWSKHVEEICKNVFSAIGPLNRVLSFISKGTAFQIYNALIMPHNYIGIPIKVIIPKLSLLTVSFCHSRLRGTTFASSYLDSGCCNFILYHAIRTFYL